MKKYVLIIIPCFTLLVLSVGVFFYGMSELQKYEQVSVLVENSKLPDNGRSIYLIENLGTKEKSLAYAIQLLKSYDGLAEARNKLADRLVTQGIYNLTIILIAAGMCAFLSILLAIGVIPLLRNVSSQAGVSRPH